MKILSRIFTVCLLLSGLAYVSYAFGKYVLSTKLFGQAVGAAQRAHAADPRVPKVAESMTRHVEYKSDKPHVEVQVLPAQDADPGPEPPPLSATERRSHSGESRGTSAAGSGPTGYDAAKPDHTGDKIVTPNDPAFNDNGPNFYGNEEGDSRTDLRPRRRRRHKKKPTEGTTAFNARAEGSADTSTSGDGDSGSSGTVSGVGTDETSSSEHVSHHTSSGDDGGSSVRHSTTRRHHYESSGGESPIPRPEGESSHSESSGGSSGGSESPIPQPE